jgi:hypothetical protein
MSTRSEAEWVVDGGDFAREWSEAQEENEQWEKEFFEPLQAQIEALPDKQQNRWRRMPLGLLAGRQRALLRLEVRRSQRRQPVLRCPRPPLRRSRGSTRMHRARRTARTCGSRGDPDDPDPPLGGLPRLHVIPLARFRREVERALGGSA